MRAGSDFGSKSLRIGRAGMSKRRCAEGLGLDSNMLGTVIKLALLESTIYNNAGGR